ncbi:fungal-specific transcription factor domain-containing protein [Aspergillus floccosus]
MACRTCRSRKVKCDRTRPSCKNCLQRGNECSYTGERRKRTQQRTLNHGSSYSQLQHINDRISDVRVTKTQQRPFPLVLSRNQFLDFLDMGEAVSISSSRESVQAATPQPTTLPGQGELLDQILEGDDVDPLKDRHPAIWMRMDDAEEYSGPSSGIAGISDLGLKWIRSQVPESDEVCRTIQYVRDGLMMHLRQCIPPQPLPNPEMPLIWKALPPLETVREYVDTYFSTVQSVFPVVDATIFDEMLTRWYQQPECQSDSWKALLNAVLASGCRAALSNDTASAFQVSSSRSWGLFQNALNYEPKLVHSTTDLLAVQALAVMTVFAQGMSCSQRLEYILCSTAARLAHSLALNRHVPPQWNMSEREQRERYRLFWVIYCLDKSIALRSGRPPVIQDEDISCPFPRDVGLLFYYPTTALATIFMHTVTTPLSVSACNDIALMEAVAGFFGRLEFMTFGEAAFTKTSEFARQARRIVEKAARQNQNKRRARGASNGHYDMENTSDQRPGSDNHDANVPVHEPVSTACPTSSGQQDFEGIGSQENGHAAHGSEGELSARNLERASSIFDNDITADIDVPFGDHSGGYFPDEWLTAARLDLA